MTLRSLYTCVPHISEVDARHRLLLLSRLSVKEPGREKKMSRYLHFALSGCMTAAVTAVVGMSVNRRGTLTA